MGGAPWIKWYAGDFLNGVSALDPAEIAVYVIVLNLIYDHGGPIADDVVKVARRCNMRPAPTKRAVDALCKCGLLVRDPGGLLYAPQVGKWEQWSRRRLAPTSVRAAVFDRDGFECAYCGDKDGPFDIDHIIPFSRGGTHDMDNLCVACCSCNRSKGSKTLEEWIVE